MGKLIRTEKEITVEELLCLYKELMRKGLRRPAGRENVEILMNWLSEGFKVTQINVLVQARHAVWIFLIGLKGSFPDEKERATAFPILPGYEGLLESICERSQSHHSGIESIQRQI